MSHQGSVALGLPGLARPWVQLLALRDVFLSIIETNKTFANSGRFFCIRQVNQQ